MTGAIEAKSHQCGAHPTK